MNPFHAVWAVAWAGVVWVAIFTIPRWLFTSITRGRLWQLRDRIYDENRRGDFVGHEAEAGELIRLVEHAIVAIPFLTLGNVRRFGRLLDAMPADERPHRIDPDMGGSLQLVERREHLHHLLRQQLLAGSWGGIVLTAGALGSELAKRMIGRRPRHTGNEPDDDEAVSVSFKVVRVEVKKGTSLADHVLHADEYLPLVVGDDHDDVLTAV